MKNRKMLNFKLNEDSSEDGQSLLELIVVIAVGIVIITALVFSAISSLRNSQLSKNQAQATRLAQEGMETLRILRDRDGTVNKGSISCHDPLAPSNCNFNTDWSVLFSCPNSSICYFKIAAAGNALNSAATASDFETFDATDVNIKYFKRQIQVVDGTDANEKKFTVIVKWTDFAGDHESRQTTLFRKLLN